MWWLNYKDIVKDLERFCNGCIKVLWWQFIILIKGLWWYSWRYYNGFINVLYWFKIFLGLLGYKAFIPTSSRFYKFKKSHTSIGRLCYFWNMKNIVVMISSQKIFTRPTKSISTKSTDTRKSGNKWGLVWYFVYITLQLDSLSREDLTKFVKKQMLLLQKTRSKCDGKFLYSLSYFIAQRQLLRKRYRFKLIEIV